MLLDEYYMKQALKLAKKAEGKTSPNPLVGCLIVKNNKVISQGFHKKAGFLHAEIEALNKIKGKAKGADLYVNLEPCFHWGRTPPCVDEIISSGVKRVVIATIDPNPLVNGLSVRKLRGAGVNVKVGVLRKEAERINEVFFKNMKANLPFVVAKFAQTLDGKIANSKGSSKWITSEKARSFSKKLRGIYDAIGVGVNTLLKDNPYLDTPAKKLVKVILDPELKTQVKANIFKKAKDVLIFTKKDISSKKVNLLKGKAKIIRVKYSKGEFNLKEILKNLYSLGITSVFVEGGSFTLGRFFDHRLVDKIYIFLAPKIMGKRDALNSIGGKGDISIDKLTELEDLSIKRIGKDFLISGYPKFK